MFSLFGCSCKTRNEISYYHYTDIITDSVESFNYNNNDYYLYDCANYGYVITSAVLEGTLAINTSEGEFGYNIYPYNFRNDKDKKILFLDRNIWILDDFSITYEIYQKLYIRSDYDAPVLSALITKVEILLSEKAKYELNYDKELFSNVFRDVNVDFIWNKKDDIVSLLSFDLINNDVIYVDVFVGIAYVSFYSEQYKRSFKIKLKIYQDKSGTCYTKCGTKIVDGKIVDNWYQMNINLNM